MGSNMKQHSRLPGSAGRCLALLSLLLPMASMAQVIYTYDAVPTSTTINDNACTSVTINVPDTFNVGNAHVAIGVDVTHTYRGDLRLEVDPPEAGEANKIFLDRITGDAKDNFRIMVSTNDDTTASSNDGSNDLAGQPVRYRRLVQYTNTGGGVGPFNDTNTNHPVNGNWVISVCDAANIDVGTFNSVRLVLRNQSEVAPASCGTKSTYAWSSNGNNVAFSTTGAINGITMTQPSTSGEATGDTSTGSNPSFRTSTGQTGNSTGGYYRFYMNLSTSGNPEPNGMEWAVFNFDVPVHGLSFSTLDTDSSSAQFEDYMRVEGFDDTAMTIQVPRQSVLANSQLSYAGDWVEGDSNVDDNSTDGNATWTFTKPVRRVRVTYAQGDQPNNNSGDQLVGIGTVSFCGFDFGDAPDSYDTNFNDGGARHTLGNRNVYMGTMPDGEGDGIGDTNADSDGADENGSLTLPTYVGGGGGNPHYQCTWSGGTYSTAPGEYCVTVNVTNNSGTGAQLVGWLDMNDDGDFLDANERSLPRLGGFTTAPSGDTTFTTANIPNGTTNVTRVLVWSGLPGANLNSDTYLRLRITTDSSFMSDSSPSPVGLASDGEVEDHRIPANTLPVTLSWVRSRIVEGKLDLRFGTASEIDNIGFTVEERGADGRFVPVAASSMIASQRNNTAEASSYATQLATVPATGKFYLVDHSSSGARAVHGPFEVGANFGIDSSAERFRWDDTANAIAQLKALARSTASSNAGKLWVEQAGFHRVTATQLAAAGVHLEGVPVERIAVTFRGQGVPRRIVPDSGNFGANSYIDFLAGTHESLYTKAFPYLVRGDAIGVVAIDRNNWVADTETSAWYWAESRYAPDNKYNHSSPTGDPWHADELLAYANQPVSRSVSLPVSAVATDVGDIAELQADLIGLTNFDGGEADHHALLQIDGQTVADERFDGSVGHSVRLRLPLFGAGQLDVGVVLPGDTGFEFDMAYIDRINLRYPRLPVADGERLFIDALQSGHAFFVEGAGDGDILHSFLSGFEGPDSVAGFRVDGLADGEIVAYVGRGDDWQWIAHSVQATGGTALLPSDTGSSYWVSNVSGLRAPQIEPLESAAPLIAGQADYLIISPTLFLDELQPLVGLQQSRGLNVRVVDLQQIYDQFNDSVPEAAAIQRFLDAAVPAMGVEYVLLVGGDTYDYKNNLGTGSISLVPTQYTKLGDVITFAPVDAFYADADRDGAPEFALGRLPVRSIAELQALTAKLVAVNGSVPDRKLMLVAQAADGEEDFAGISDAFAAQLPNTWATSRAYADDLGTAGARSALLGALNGNVQMVSYVGHSAALQWGSNAILSATDIASTTGTPVDLVVQWGCWNSYFVSPNANSLAHKFLNTAGHGAAGVIGVSSLTELSAHEALGSALYPELSVGTRIGDALRLAKMQLATEGTTHADILNAATLLGDPAQPVR